MTASPAHRFALAFGGLYVLLGIAGFFVTGFDNWFADTSRALLIFDLNPFHNVVHLGIGLYAIGAARFLSAANVRGVNTGIGAVYLLAAAAGFVGALEQLLSAEPGFAPDNFLHLASGALFLALGIGGIGREPSLQQVP